MQAQRRSRVPPVAWLAAAAGIIIALGIAAWHTLDAPAEGVAIVVASSNGVEAHVFRAGSAVPLVKGSAVTSGDRVAAGAGDEVAMRLSTGSTVKVEAAGELQVLEAGPSQRFALLRGAMRAQVAKLRQGERFVVATGDAEVEVRGTAFRLSAGAADTVCEEGSATRLEVFEGVVAVRRGGVTTLVGAGGRWPSNCRSPSDPVAATTVPLDPAPRPPAEASARVRRPAVAARPHAPTPVEDPGSTLAEENDLFARAVAARRRGDRQGALARFLELEHRFPTSPLGESAMVERMRLVGVADQEAARSVAREYLARYPAGFARSEAAVLAGDPTQP
jgi:hypothetical protein